MFRYSLKTGPTIYETFAFERLSVFCSLGKLVLRYGLVRHSTAQKSVVSQVD